eukprot:2813974-Amphidinium_carterae.1
MSPIFVTHVRRHNQVTLLCGVLNFFLGAAGGEVHSDELIFHTMLNNKKTRAHLGVLLQLFEHSSCASRNFEVSESAGAASFCMQELQIFATKFGHSISVSRAEEKEAYKVRLP